ncbi:MAG TPA: RDD family protein [Chitinophagaceae bacterium]|nr:RDD family protein [Chitinophagaceae bacterium]
MPSIQINTPFNLALDFEVAGLHKRILAYFIDLSILVIYSWGMKAFLADIISLEHNKYGIDILLVSIPMLLYSFVCEVSLRGQSLGKKIVGIRVMSLEGGEPTISQYLLRWATRFFEWPLVFSPVMPGFGVLVQLFFVGFFGVFVVIIIAISKANQRLGDLGAGTVVVDVKSKTYLHETIFLDVSAKDYIVEYPEVMKLTDRDINTIKSILDVASRKGDLKLAASAAEKIKTHLKIKSSLYPFDFLEKVLMDYNYISTKQ